MSDAPVVKGLNEMTLVRRGKRWSADNGEQYVEEWAGPSAQAETFYTNYVNDPDLDDVDFPGPDRGRGVVRLVYKAIETGAAGPQDEDNNAVWEVYGNTFVKDLRTAPYFNPSGSIYQYIIEADAALERGEKYEYADVPTWSANIQRYLGLKLAGVEGYNFSGAVIRKSIKVSTRGTIVASWKDVNFVVDLATDINPPAAVIGVLSELERPVAGQMGDGTRESASWEWLKQCPVIRTAGSPRLFEIQYEWWGADQWSKVLYGERIEALSLPICLRVP